jgi:hypothetical protein
MALRAARSVTPCCISLHTEPSSIWRNVRTVLTVKIPADRAACRKAGCRLVHGELRLGATAQSAACQKAPRKRATDRADEEPHVTIRYISVQCTIHMRTTGLA